MNDGEFDSWNYWNGKYGEEEALTTYYPDLLRTDPILASAHASMAVARLAINARMQQLIESK